MTAVEIPFELADDIARHSIRAHIEYQRQALDEAAQDKRHLDYEETMRDLVALKRVFKYFGGEL